MKMIKWFGSITGIIGALMLALNNDFSGYGYIFFILSSFSLTFDFFRDKLYSMIWMQAIFLMINLIGGYQWIL